MAEFTLDTSGDVRTPDQSLIPGCTTCRVAFEDLDPFTQGYVERMARDHFADLAEEMGGVFHGHAETPPLVPAVIGYRHIASETLAAILKDCAAHPNAQPHKHPGDTERQRRAGRNAWEDRNPPLTIYLGDDGKVRFPMSLRPDPARAGVALDASGEVAGRVWHPGVPGGPWTAVLADGDGWRRIGHAATRDAALALLCGPQAPPLADHPLPATQELF